MKFSVDSSTGAMGRLSILTSLAGVGKEGQATGNAGTHVNNYMTLLISPPTYWRYHQHCVITGSSTVVSSDGQVVLSVVRDIDLCRCVLNSEW